MNSTAFFEVTNLRKYYTAAGGIFSHRKRTIRAVDNVTFTVNRGETLGLVGESGCGKSTIAKLLVCLTRPDSGQIAMEGKNIFAFDRKQMLRFRRRVQIVFQDPLSSLNPRMTIERIISEPLSIHNIVPKNAVRDRVAELLSIVGLQPEAARRYPHEFSSGQRQRICIARALSLNPECIIADEPVSALDVSIQAQTLNLLAELQERFHLTYVFISHDLNIIRHLCDRVAVMYAGKIVEVAPREDLYRQPLHPYTEALLSAVPIPDPLIKPQRIILNGEVPDASETGAGCVFAKRCPIVHRELCEQYQPPLTEKRSGHWAACFIKT